MDVDTQPMFSELLTSLQSHQTPFNNTTEESLSIIEGSHREELNETGKSYFASESNGGQRSDSPSPLESLSTPESMKSLEPIPNFPARHLLSNFSDKQLDAHFSSSPSECSTRETSDSTEESLSPVIDDSDYYQSDNGYFGSKETSASPVGGNGGVIIEDIYEGLVFDEVNGDLKEVRDDISEVEIFEPRELSIVLEETEESEAEDTETA